MMLSKNILNLQNKNQYKKNGWLKLSGLISIKQAKILKKKIKGLLAKNTSEFDKKNINFIKTKNKKKKLHTFHKLSAFKEIKKFAVQDKFYQITKTLISEKPKFRKCELFAKPAKIGLKSPPHQDNFYWCLKNGKSLTFWIALDKSSKVNGALYYYNNSHKLGLLNHKASHVKGSSQTVKNLKILKHCKKITPKLN